MSLLRYIRRRQWDEERMRELEAHLAQETDDNVARGMTPEEARRRARMKLGNPTIIREEIWKMNSFVSVEDLGRDIRYAFRQLWKSPGFATIAIVTLALGIGVNTAIFSMVNGLMFSSFHIRQESRVIEVGYQQKGTPWQPNLSEPEYEALRDQTKDVFSEVIADRQRNVRLYLQRRVQPEIILWRHSDNRHRMSIQQQPPAHHIGIYFRKC